MRGIIELFKFLYALINISGVSLVNLKRLQNSTNPNEIVKLQGELLSDARNLVDNVTDYSSLLNRTVDVNAPAGFDEPETLEFSAAAANMKGSKSKSNSKAKAKARKTPAPVGNSPPSAAPTQLQTKWNQFGIIRGVASNLGFPYGYNVAKDNVVYLVGSIKPKSTPVFVFGEGANSFAITVKPITAGRNEISYNPGANVAKQVKVVRGIKHWPVECFCIDGAYSTALTPDGREIKDADGYDIIMKSSKMFNPNSPAVISLSQSGGDADLVIYSTQKRTVAGVVDGEYRDDWPVMTDSWSMATTMFWDGKYGSTSEGKAMAAALGKVRVQLDPGQTLQAQREFPEHLFPQRRQLAGDKNELLLAKRFGALRAALLDEALQERGITAEQLQDLPEAKQKEIALEVGKNLRAAYIEKFGEEGLGKPKKGNKLRGGN